MERDFKKYPTYENYNMQGFWFGLLLWSVLGFIIGIIIGNIVDFTQLSFMTAIIFGFIGFLFDTKEIRNDEIAGIYDAINTRPKFNVSGTRIWLLFFTRRIGKIYDYTGGISTVPIIDAPTHDTRPRQFVSAFFDISEYVSDPLAYENNAGSSDLEEILTRHREDRLQAWTRTCSLVELEESKNIEVEGGFLKDIKDYSLQYGLTVTGNIPIRGITTSSDAARKNFAETFYNEENEDQKQMRLAIRVNYRYISMLSVDIPNKDIIDFTKQAKQMLDTNSSEFEISSKARNLAEAEYPKKDARKLYKEAYASEEIRQKLVEEKRYKGLDGVRPFMNV